MSDIFYLLAVAVGKRIGHLVDVFSRDALLEPSLGLLLEALVELPLGRELEDEVDPALVIEVAEQAEDVGVAEVGLDLDFSPSQNICTLFHIIYKYILPQLVLHLSFLEL